MKYLLNEIRIRSIKSREEALSVKNCMRNFRDSLYGKEEKGNVSNRKMSKLSYLSKEKMDKKLDKLT